MWSMYGVGTKPRRVPELRENMLELMTLQEVANYLRVTKKTIHRLLGSGKIPATKVGSQ